ncbi:MAG: 4Fe-4S dicluster domain-containing protein [Thermoflexales bacterium]|nr:4Fe-4S dicluster domain-containing protein [Thermoflexales bacterium]
MTTAVAATRPKTFVDEVMDATPGHSRLEMCIQCGTCGGSCPSGPDMDHSPRQLFAMIRAGMRKEVLKSNTPWYCVSCYFCYVRCPQEVHITDLMYTLKSLAIKEKNFDEKAGAGLAETFTDYVEQDGRSFEFGLATWHNLKHRPTKLPGMAGLGMGMLQKGRMDMTRHKIQGIGQLQAILNKAKELEEAAS